MQAHRIAQLIADHLSARAGLRPGAGPAKPRRGLLIGFDTEWQGDTKALLSVQFAALVDDAVVSSVYNPRAKKLSNERLLALVATFIQEQGIQTPERGEIDVYLVAHFAGAELSTLEDALRDSQIQTLGKAHFADLQSLSHEGRVWRLRIVDLYAIYPMALKEVGAAIGLPKIELPEGVIEDLASFRRKDPAKFREYAVRDAEIAVLAMHRLRESLLDEWGVDPLFYKTTASIALAVFRHRFLTTTPVRSRIEIWPGRGKVHVVEDHQLRRVALQAYWGGRNEAYIRGIYRGPVADYDVKSMYPYAAIMQPLPNAETRWRRLALDERREFGAGHECLALEGFVTVEFAFPSACEYPCLPVEKLREDKLYFPRKGRSHCTLAELRVAAALGAEFRIIELCGFRPAPQDFDHDVGRFMKHFLEAKKLSKAGTLKYETTKLILNALIGKLAERAESDLTTKVERHGRLQGVSGLAALFAGSAAMRGVLKGAPRIGTGWCPEYAALIIGRARAVMGEIVAKTKPLMVVTDGVLVRAGALSGVDIPALEELRRAGSDLELKAEAEAAWVARDRLYALLKARAGGEWTIEKLARHGMPSTKADAEKDVLACIHAHRDVTSTRKKKRLAKATEAARRGLRINDDIVEERKPLFRWDNKRRLLDRDVNLFAGYSKTIPYATIGGIAKADVARERTKARERAKRRRLARPVVEEATRLLREGGLTVRQVADRTGIRKSSVGNLRMKLMREGLLPATVRIGSGKPTASGVPQPVLVSEHAISAEEGAEEVDETDELERPAQK